MKEKQLFKLTLSIIAIALLMVVDIMLLNKTSRNLDYMYISSNSPNVKVLDKNKIPTKDLYRGTKVEFIKRIDEYYKIRYLNKEYLISKDNLSLSKDDVVKEQEVFVRTPVTFYENDKLSLIKKGEQVKVLGYDYYDNMGIVNKYNIEYKGIKGYLYGKYMVATSELALLNYDETGNYQAHLKRGNTLGGGSAANLDYYPVIKPTFKDNVMPKEARTLYMNTGVLGKVDQYITFAKANNINAFVVDIKDNTAPGYPSEVMKKYSITNYNHAMNSFDKYQKTIKKLKDNGFYVIGRITAFKDSYYVADHKEDAILDTNTGLPFLHNSSYWPSAFIRDVWEYNVELAKEAVTKMGFNEIQFDYVRFPDRVNKLEVAGQINILNPYGEEKAQAIQTFLMYATDEIHAVGAYVSADVFGESAHNYVTAYGQYFAAISNVVDVISPMPYPDHFGAHEYGFDEVVWTTPYKLLNFWATTYVVKRQKEIPTPALVRNWIQVFDTNKSPKVIYDTIKVSDEIQALYDAGLKGGFMTWSASSSLTKYEEVKEAFKKEY